MISAWEMAGLAGSAVGAGLINAVAGGGTLLTFPTLLAFGVSPITANATSTLALVVGTSGSMFGYRRHIQNVKPWLRRFLPVSLIGGVIGSVWLTKTSNATFARLIPFLILFATMLFLAQGTFLRFAKSHLDEKGSAKSVHMWWPLAFQFLVAVYGGYFGAGIGILMLATLGIVGMRDIFEMNTVKTILGSLINLMAAIWFMCVGLIDWERCGIMTVGAVVGYYVGSHYSQRIPQTRVRQIITAIGFIISALTFYKEFLR